MKIRAMTAALALYSVSACALDVAEESALGVETENLTIASDFRVGIQVADRGSSLSGDWVHTASYESSGNWSGWACDTNCFDPDSMRLELDAITSDQVRGRDLRVCMQASDGRTSHSDVGVSRCTPWASQGGGGSGLVTDGNGRDPDSYRTSIETRAWPTNTSDHAVDIRLRLRAYDDGQWGAFSAWTGWATQGGGMTPWTTDSNAFDPDGFEIELGTAERSVDSFCSPRQRCEAGFGDCDTDADCIIGTTCQQDVGFEHGYSNPSVDVCVD